MTINWKKPTAQMLGRFQPFHDGHKTLFKEILKRTGQVIVMIRDTSGTDDSNPFNFDIVKKNIESNLTEYEGKFEVIKVPNITNVCYGRGVGWKVEQIILPKDIEEISEGGYLLYDSTWKRNFNRDDINIIEIPLTQLCVDTFKNPKLDPIW